MTKKRKPFTEDEYNLALGRALSAWGNVESVLDLILYQLIKPRDIQQLTRVFLSVPNFRDRLRMVDTAIEHGDLTDSMSVKWVGFHKRMRRLSGRRNDIAHATAWVSPEFGAFGHKHVIFLSDLPREWRKRVQLVLTPPTITQITTAFDKLTDDLVKFQLELSTSSHGKRPRQSN